VWRIEGYDMYAGGSWVVCDSEKCRREGQDASDFCMVRQIVLAPGDKNSEGEVAIVREFIAWVNDTYPSALLPSQNSTYPPLITDEYEDNAAMESYIASTDYSSAGTKSIGGAIIVTSSTSTSFEYKIRPNSTFFAELGQVIRPLAKTMPNTKILTDRLASSATSVSPCSPTQEGGPVLKNINSGEGGQPSCYGLYILNGGLGLGRLVGDFLVHHNTGGEANVAEAGVNFVNYPSKESYTAGFWDLVLDLLPLVFLVANSYPILRTVKIIVAEKEGGQNELMQIMGISQAAMNLSWSITFGLLAVITGSMMSVPGIMFFSESDPSIIFFFFQMQCFLTMAYCFLVSSYFDVAKVS